MWYRSETEGFYTGDKASVNDIELISDRPSIYHLPVVENGLHTGNWYLSAQGSRDYKSWLRQQVASERYIRENSFISVNGRKYATDDRSKLLITTKALSAEISSSPDSILPFKTADSNGEVVWYDLPYWELRGISIKGQEYVQACFNEERRQQAEIDANEEITEQWPSNVFEVTREEIVSRPTLSGIKTQIDELAQSVDVVREKSGVLFEQLSGVTGSNGSVTIQFANTYSGDIVIEPRSTWSGDQIIYTYIKSQTQTTITLGAKRSRSTIALSSGPFQEAPAGSQVSVLVFGK